MARIAGESPRTARHIKLSHPSVADPVVLCCEISGDGPPLILVPGLGDTVWVWRHLVPVIQQRSRVLAVELRGHGRSASPTGPYTAEEMAGDLFRLAEELKIVRPALIAQGFGARLALLLAIERPGFAAGLVLIGAETGPPQSAALAEMREHAGRGDLGAAYKSRKEIIPAPRGMSPRERAEHHRIFLRNAPTGYAAACAAVEGAPALDERLGEIDCPVLALAGERDEGRHAGARRLAELISDCSAVIIDGAGHFVQLDAPESFQVVLEDFLGERLLIAPKK